MQSGITLSSLYLPGTNHLQGLSNIFVNELLISYKWVKRTHCVLPGWKISLLEDLQDVGQCAATVASFITMAAFLHSM